MKSDRKITCYGLSRGRDWQQEWYETASRDARKRASELRKLGFKVVTSQMGTQVTSSGAVKMSLVTVCNLDYYAEVPAPDSLVRI